MRRIAAVVAGVLVAALVGLGGPSARADDPAADTRPCVSKREFNSMLFQTRTNLEARWEVTGRGRSMSQTLLDFDSPKIAVEVAYPRCGHPNGNRWYGVLYQRRGKNLWALYGVACCKIND